MQVLSVVQMCRYEHSAGSSLLVVVVGKRKKKTFFLFASLLIVTLSASLSFHFFRFLIIHFFSIIFHFSGAFCPTYLPFFCLSICYYLSFFLLLSYIFFPFFPIIFHFSGAFSPTYLPFFCLYIFYYLSFFLLLSCIFFLSLYFYYDLCVPVSSFRCKKYRLIE